MYTANPIDIVQKYINENLDQSLTLKEIADVVHYSPYWLSRFYLRQTGETVMGYIRKERLRRAARELLKTGCDITKLAFQLGYDSSDGFSRAFKMHYGISPLEYKKSGLFAPETEEQEESAMTIVSENYDYALLTKLDCSVEEKRMLFPLIEELVEMAGQARKNGLFELEKKYGSASEELLRKGITLIVDGVEPGVNRKIFLNYLLCENKTGVELLKGILIAECILAVQQGAHPLLIREMLCSYLGKSMISEAEKYFEHEGAAAKVMNYVLSLSEQPSAENETSLLEGPFHKISDRCLQRLLRELDSELIAAALKGVSNPIRIKVLNNVSVRQAGTIIAGLDEAGKYKPAYIIEAQKMIMDIAKMLIKEGEIII